MTYLAIAWCVVTVGACYGFYTLFVELDGDSKGKKILSGLIMFLICISIIGGICWWSLCTESGKRAYKDQQSNVSGGISRIVRVYDMEGDLIEEYDGTFDVETNEHYVLFDDENGKRHMIYFTTGTIIIDEVEEEDLPVAMPETGQ